MTLREGKSVNHTLHECERVLHEGRRSQSALGQICSEAFQIAHFCAHGVSTSRRNFYVPGGAAVYVASAENQGWYAEHNTPQQRFAKKAWRPGNVYIILVPIGIGQSTREGFDSRSMPCWWYVNVGPICSHVGWIRSLPAPGQRPWNIGNVCEKHPKSTNKSLTSFVTLGLTTLLTQATLNKSGCYAGRNIPRCGWVVQQPNPEP